MGRSVTFLSLSLGLKLTPKLDISFNPWRPQAKHIRQCSTSSLSLLLFLACSQQLRPKVLSSTFALEKVAPGGTLPSPASPSSSPSAASSVQLPVCAREEERKSRIYKQRLFE